MFRQDYKDEYGDYENTVLNAQYDITVRKISALVDLAEGKIKFETGVNCDYSRGDCEDIDAYSYYWNVATVDECDVR